MGIRGVVDGRFRQVVRMAFNAGVKDRSVVMDTGCFDF
jgi:hypothetical protein